MRRSCCGSPHRWQVPAPPAGFTSTAATTCPLCGTSPTRRASPGSSSSPWGCTRDGRTALSAERAAAYRRGCSRTASPAERTAAGGADASAAREACSRGVLARCGPDGPPYVPNRELWQGRAAVVACGPLYLAGPSGRTQGQTVGPEHGHGQIAHSQAGKVLTPAAESTLQHLRGLTSYLNSLPQQEATSRPLQHSEQLGISPVFKPNIS